MTTSNENCVTSSYEGYCNDYQINLKLYPSNVTITAEHRITRQIYQCVCNNDQCTKLTNSVCDTACDLYEFLKFLMENECNIKDERNLQSLIVQRTNDNRNIELQVTTAMIFSASRQIQKIFRITLDKVQLEDIARLENIINDLYRRVEDLEFRNVPFNRAIRLKHATFQTPSSIDMFTLTNEKSTCTNGVQTHRILCVDRPFSQKQDRYQKITFLWNTSVNQNSYIGVRQLLPTSETTVDLDTENSWYFVLSNGNIYTMGHEQRAYANTPVKQGQQVSIILDTQICV